MLFDFFPHSQPGQGLQSPQMNYFKCVTRSVYTRFSLLGERWSGDPPALSAMNRVPVADPTPNIPAPCTQDCIALYDQHVVRGFDMEQLKSQVVTVRGCRH